MSVSESKAAEVGESVDSSGDKTRTVHLVSQEGESFDVPLEEAKMSELVKTMIDGCLNFSTILFLQ